MRILVSNIDCCKLPFSFRFHADSVKEKILALQNPLRQRQSYLGDMMILDSFKNCIQYIDYRYGSYGKPILNFASHLHFSKSHCQDYVVTVASNEPVGVDIEVYDEKLLKISGKFLNEEEMRRLHEQDIANDFLLTAWTIKESFAKYLGMGLNLDFRKISIDYNRGIARCGAKGYAYFRIARIFKDYVIAICTTKEIKGQLNIKRFVLKDSR